MLVRQIMHALSFACAATFDMTYRLACLSSVSGVDANELRPVISSSANSQPRIVRWFDWTIIGEVNKEDPWISINNHMTTPTLVLYGENSVKHYFRYTKCFSI
jgi:hypothetical protein